ncbi:hypothetical protein NQT62_03660 [Limnobacter humi]|uniref:Uncharacterized protein n=1 Tax=Limnobacter humi TaxID=1778671 RepID=A0ABT1WFL1_9BURK|nr:hypothetical protein [Limnobacter humi]MCQ8895537.1 hypothetical protein [Limnobacter humi]
MNGYEIATATVSQADKKMALISEKMTSPDFGSDIGDLLATQFQMSVVGISWSAAGKIVDDLTAPLKTIVNR